MSETIRNLGKKPRSKKEAERRYQEFISDDFIFSLDEVLGVLGPRKETI